MTSRDFCYWLQGYFELQNPERLDKIQLDMVKNHLSLVFKHEIDPSMGDEEHQTKLNLIHGQISVDQAIEKWGPQPSPNHVLSSLHGWYNPAEGIPRC